MCMATLPACDHARACPCDGDRNTDTTAFVLLCWRASAAGTWLVAESKLEPPRGVVLLGVVTALPLLDLPATSGLRSGVARDGARVRLP